MIGRSLTHYDIIDKIGEGGMGVVYKARDRRLNRLVAIKVLPSDRVADETRRARFTQEAQSASALHHPNIVTIHEIDRDGDSDFMVMELVSGHTLDSVIPRHGLKLNEALKYAIQIADALSAAHRSGIIHRDLKPSNIIITSEGAVKILDFGLAKLREPGKSFDSTGSMGRGGLALTDEGVVLGTAAYMSPEQAEGKTVDERSDIFSFGSVLYEMLSGNPAFRGDSQLSTITAILRDNPKPLTQFNSSFPRDLERIVTRCLRKEVSRRFQHMDDVRVALEEIKEEFDSGTLTNEAPAPAKPGAGSFRWIAAVVVVLAAAAAIVGAFAVRDRSPAASNALNETPLTTYPGSEVSPSLSPDGNQVAFSWNGESGTDWNIWVQLVKGSGLPLQITRHPGMDTAPAWAPDGTQLAFHRDGAIYLISPLGGPERKLAEVRRGMSGGSIAWSPDGKLLAVTDQLPEQTVPGITVITVPQGEKRTVTKPLPPVHLDMRAAFSPDSRRLVFFRLQVGNANSYSSAAALYSIDVNGGEPVRLTEKKATALGVTWIPGTNDVLFSTGDALWRMGSSASSEPQRFLSLGGTISDPTMSRTGRLVYSRVVGDVNIYALDVGSGTAKPIVTSTRRDRGPQISPDQRRVVFASDRSGTSEIWLSEADGRNPVALTSLGGTCHSPRWSPRSNYVVFSCLLGTNRDIYVLSPEGGPPRRLTTEESEEGRPSVSRDGKWVYFYSTRGGERHIWKVPIEGGPASKVTSTNPGWTEAVESWDGQRLYMTRFLVNEEPGLWSMDVRRGEPRLEHQAVSSGWWDVTARGVIFADVHDSFPRLIWLWRPGEKPIQLGQIAAELVSQGRDFSASADGKRIMWAQIDNPGADLMLVENIR